MSYSLIVNREPRLLILSAYRKTDGGTRLVQLTLSPGANVNFRGLSDEDIDAIRSETFVKELEKREVLEFVKTKEESPKEESSKEKPASKRTKKRKKKKSDDEDDF
jgi:hypothetical protein